MDKVVSSLKEAIRLCGLKDGMTVSFHHHLSNGDFVLNIVLNAIAELGIKNLCVNASSIFDIHAPLVDCIKNHVVTGLETDYMSGVVGHKISEGILDKPVVFRSHGGRAADIDSGKSKISHGDMDIFTFMGSAASLFPYFRDAVLLGLHFQGTPEQLFVHLRIVGKQAEDEMFSATNGINTHKGLIYSMGIICSAIGYLK